MGGLFHIHQKAYELKVLPQAAVDVTSVAPACQGGNKLV